MLFVWLVLLQLIVFAVLVFFLRLIFSRNVSTATAHLHELNADYSQKLDEAKKRQAEADKYYDDMITKAKAEAEKSKVQILTETRETQGAMLNEARKQSADIVSQAANAREEMIQGIKAEIEVRSTEKAAEMLGLILPDIITKDLHNDWVDDLLKNGLGDIAKMNLGADVVQAQVKSAHALTPEQKTLLQKKMKDALKRDITLTAETDPSLVAGIIVTLGSVVVDGSLKLKIKDLVRHAQNSARS